MSAPILIFPDDSRPFQVEVDSSDFAMEAVLSQQSQTDDKWHPVAYYSKSLNAVEQNYEIHDKEMLAIDSGGGHGRCAPTAAITAIVVVGVVVHPLPP